MRLTAAQVRVLRILREGPKVTSKTTHHGCVSGQCASALVRMGLVWLESSGYEVLARLTTAGNAEIDAYGRAENGSP